jgi:DNA-binding NarL/FixJ family response regulator
MVAGTRIRVFFVNDQRVMTDALAAMLSGYANIDIIGASDGQGETLAQRRGLQPDVVVVELAGGCATNVVAVRRALHQWPRARVIVLSPFFHHTFVEEVLRAGAHGYITMQCASHELIEGVRVVTSGSTYLCSKVNRGVLKGLAQGGAGEAKCEKTAMTNREGMILHLFGEGCSSRDIAATLNLSSKTIDASRRQIMSKLDVDSPAGLVKSAIALGLTTVDPWPACSV